MVTIKDLHKHFGKKEVLMGLNVTFQLGTITAVLGPNGSGKTTLIKSIMGMVIPTSGTIEIDGEDIHRKSRYRERISYLPQIARFPENLKVREILTMASDLKNLASNHRQLVSRFELEPFLDQALKSLSGGTLQKVNLVLALMCENDLIILDEPTSGLDPVAMQKLRQLIFQLRKDGKIVIMTTHIMSFAEEMADRIVYLLEGKIYFDGSLVKLKKMFGQVTLEGAIAELLQNHQAKSNGRLADRPLAVTGLK